MSATLAVTGIGDPHLLRRHRDDYLPPRGGVIHCNCHGGPHCCLVRRHRQSLVPWQPFVPGCGCPPVWHGVIPPPCPIHNPPKWERATKTTTVTVVAPVVVKKRKPAGDAMRSEDC